MCKDNELHGHSHGEHHEHEEGHPHSGSDGHEHQHAHPHGSDEGHEHAHDHSHDHEHKHSHPHSDDHDHGSEHTHTEAHDHEHTHEHAHPHPHKHEHPHPHGGQELGHAHPHPHGHEHPHPHGQGHCGKHGENGAKCPNHGDIENKDVEILGLLLNHWVTHNQDHAMEYNTWVEKMNRLGKNDVAESLIEAIALMSEADKHLIEAKKELD